MGPADGSAPSLRRTVWAAPAVARAPAPAPGEKPAAGGAAALEPGVHFRVVRREPGAERTDLPVWAPLLPGLVPFDDAAAGPTERADVPGVPGAFVLSNVLTEPECHALAQLSEAMGYTMDAPVSLGRNIRRNENCVIIADDSMWKPVWRRIAAHMPPRVAGGGPVGLNQRWRLYKYGPNDTFKMHTDGAWPGSALDDQGELGGSAPAAWFVRVCARGRPICRNPARALQAICRLTPRVCAPVQDFFGDRYSQLTLLLYLDDDYEGGETTFFIAGELVSVRVPKGGALCFFHGEHELSPLHEGSIVTRGCKRIVRSDVLYTLPGAQCRQR